MNAFHRWQIRKRKRLRQSIAKGRRHFLWHYGVLRWGLPVALFGTAVPWRGFGYFTSVEFWIGLIFSIPIIGIGGGHAFGWFMWNLVKDTPPEVEEDRPPSTPSLAEGFAHGVVSASHLYATAFSTTLFFGLLLGPCFFGAEYVAIQAGAVLFGAITACGLVWLVRRQLDWPGTVIASLVGGGAVAFFISEIVPAEPAWSTIAVLVATADLALGVYGLKGTYADTRMLIRSPDAERRVLDTSALRRGRWQARGAYALMFLNACIILAGLWAITTGYRR